MCLLKATSRAGMGLPACTAASIFPGQRTDSNSITAATNRMNIQLENAAVMSPAIDVAVLIMFWVLKVRK